MTKAIFKYKVEYKDDNNKPIKKHFCNTKEIREQLGIPRSSLFIMLDESKPDIEKFRKYKVTRCNIPKYVQTENVISD